MMKASDFDTYASLGYKTFSNEELRHFETTTAHVWAPIELETVKNFNWVDETRVQKNGRHDNLRGCLDPLLVVGSAIFGLWDESSLTHKKGAKEMGWRVDCQRIAGYQRTSRIF